ncbi:MAG: Crp/Fnr family transcriptional regulator [Saprospiraceae bacterium]|nr:Crp/Fnr family transcriptional regulator [Saprospiraceae bacterium]
MNSLGWSHEMMGVSFLKKNYKKGAHIYRKDDHVQDVYRILKGRVKLCRFNEEVNRHIIFHIRQPFDFFGVLDNIINLEFRRCAAIALDNEVVIQIIPFSEFKKYIFSSYDNRLAFMETIAKNERTIWSKVVGLKDDNITQRVFNVIERLVIEKGRKTERGIVIKGMSHIDLAEYIGASRQSVTTAMNKFRKEGKLDYSRKQILIFNKNSIEI